MKFSKFFSLVALGTMVLLTGCDNKTNNQASNNDPDAFTILAGSEVKDMEPLLQQAQDKLGFKINIKYTSTMDGVAQVASGANYDTAWFSQSKYFYDSPEAVKRIKLSEKIMLSPVVVGVRNASYSKLNVKNITRISWSDIYEWVNQKHLTYAMTDPSESNTGYVGLMGVAYSLSGKGESLNIGDVDTQKMQNFFAGHVVNAGSSGWLMDAFSKSKADFVINYESLLIQYNKSHPQDPLTLIYPFEGIVTSDYPILLINSSKTEEYKKLTNFLKSEEAQKWIAQNTYRRSLNNQITAQQMAFSQQMLIEMPFNADADLSEKLLTAYYNEFKKPAAVIFVLDTSGSMQGEREQQLKAAMESLTVNVPVASRFAKLREREEVWVLPFSAQPYGLKKFDMGQTSEKAQATRKEIDDYVNGLQMGGGTDLFDTTLQAVQMLKDEMNKNPQYRYSVIVFTDGESNIGINSDQFIQQVQSLETGDPIRVFPILFGEGDKTQLDNIAKATGGKIFDGKSKALSSVFKEIRSYQ